MSDLPASIVNPAHPTEAAVYVRADGVPDAWVNGAAVELVISQPLSAIRTVIVIPIAEAEAWAQAAHQAVHDATSRLRISNRIDDNDRADDDLKGAT